MYLQKLFGLEGKVGIVTGGGRGIGQTVAEGLAKAGADIVIFSRGDAEETIRLVEAAGRKAVHLSVDVTDIESVQEGVNKAVQAMGRIDFLFNNAGICIHKSTSDVSIPEWDSVLTTNLTGPFIVSKVVGQYMIDNKIEGSIVNNASMSGTIVNIPQWQASYNASKAGLIHLTKSLAVEWADYGIRVNSISPGYTATPMSVDTPQELKDAWMPMMPMHRMCKPEELVGAVIYFVSNASGYTNGADLIIDGAYSCI